MFSPQSVARHAAFHRLRNAEACYNRQHVLVPTMCASKRKSKWLCSGLSLALGLFALLPRPAMSRSPTPVAVVDLHVDWPYQVTYQNKAPAQGNGRYVAEWLEQSGISAAVLPLYVPKKPPQSPTMEDLKHVWTFASQALQRTPPWRASDSVRAACGWLAKASGPTAFFAFEGATPLGFDLASVRGWAERVRLFGLVHAHDTAVASSSGYRFRKPGFGLTRRGQELVRRIHAHGGIVDVSHASDATIADVLALAKLRDAPVVATHSNARAVTNHPRNLTDAQLRAIGESGGVVGVAFHAPFLTGALEATLDDVVRHILHVRRVAGIETVAIGSDFEGGIRPPAQLSDVRGFPLLAQALREAGLSEPELSQVFGQNARRVLCGP